MLAKDFKLVVFPCNPAKFLLSLPPGASRFAWLKFLAGYSQWALAQGFWTAGCTACYTI